MNENLHELKPTQKLTSFGKFCCTIGHLPSSYMLSLTYEEQLLWFCDYLKNTVIPAVNNNAEAVQELQNLFDELTEYVNHYFDNLDIQTEINAKLDDMAESGELAEIINQELFTEINNKITAVENILTEESKIHFIANTSEEAEASAFVGDCILITGAKNILVDVGNQTNASALLDYLQNNNITKLDYIIISHYHNDHIGGSNAEGFLALINDNSIDFSECTVILPHKNINYSRFVPTSDTNVFRTREQLIMNALNGLNINYEFATEGEEIELSSNEKLEFYNCDSAYYSDYYDFTLDGMGNDVEYTNYNNFSLITMYSHFGNKIALTSDIEELAESKNYQHFNNINLFKVEHHGLNCYSNENYLRQLNPNIAVICNSQYYSYPDDYAHPTTFEVTSKGAKLYTTRGANQTITFVSNYEGIFAEQDTKTKLNNMQYDLWSGQEILAGSDLNDFTTPGVYNSNNATRTATLLNLPTSIAGNKFPTSGFKLIVENLQGYNNNIRQLIIPANDIVNSQFYIRNTYEGSFDGTSWKTVTPSTGFGSLNTSEIDTLEMVKVAHTSWSNRIIKRNDIVQLQFSMAITNEVPASSVLIEIPETILKLSSQSGYFWR